MRTARENAFTLAEVMVALAGSIIVIGALLAGSIGLQKSFHASEAYADNQANGRRLIDYVGRDLRRAIGIATCGSSGMPIHVDFGAIPLDEQNSLVLSLPAYYRSNSSGDLDYATSLPIVAAGDRVAFGEAAGPAPPFPVTYRKLFMMGEKCVCFVREEGDTREVIVRNVEDLSLQITVAPDGDACTLEARFRSTFSIGRPLIALHDQIMLRNTRLDQTP